MLNWALKLCGLVFLCVLILIPLLQKLAVPVAHTRGSLSVRVAEKPDAVPSTTAQTTINLTQSGELKVKKSPDGHYWLEAIVNGHPLKFVVDTGASTITLNKPDAAMLGLVPASDAFTGYSNTANGVVRFAPIRLSSLSLAQMSWSDIPATVIDAPMSTNLLGMSFLNNLKSFSFESDTLILRP